MSPSRLETLVDDAQRAATLDLLQAAARSRAFDRAFLITEEDELAEPALAMSRGWGSELRLVVEPGRGHSEAGAFHFGERLRALCREQGLERVVYVGGGAMPLVTSELLAEIATTVGGPGECVASNNLYSADMVAFWPASALDRIPLPPADNDLAWLLHYRAGLPFAPLPRTLASQLDIDTPSDLAALWWAAGAPPARQAVGPHMAKVLNRVPAEVPGAARTVERAYEAMSKRRAEVLVAGRVSSWVWRRLETNLPSQTRVISEERGMRASGREARGEVRSLLGLYVDAMGARGLVRGLEEVCDAAFIDSRVLFGHRGLSLSRADRFASDALLPEEVTDDWAREFTHTVKGAAIPIVLGGHSLIAGCLWALSERVRAEASASGG